VENAHENSQTHPNLLVSTLQTKSLQDLAAAFAVAAMAGN
jgi:hypothetical protein